VPDTRPELSISEAAAAAGVDRRTIRRKLDAGDFPNASRGDGRQGPATGPWVIPVTDLLGAGLQLHAPTQEAAGQSAPNEKPVVSDLERLQVELAEWRRRAELAEAIAVERDRTIEVQSAAMRMLNVGQPTAESSQQRRWWNRDYTRP
jgi:hypothetical protein